jgi:CRP-like cAMP-binding protein
VENPASFVSTRLQGVSAPARKLFDLIVREAYHGLLRSKAQGTATPPEILEACGLDVGEFYALLDVLKEAGLIRVWNSYPFEEIQLTPEAEEAFRDLA